MARARRGIELSIRLGNAPGSGAALFGKLKDANVNVVASCCYQIDDAAHFSIVADDEEQAANLLRDAGFSPKLRPVVLVEMPNETGAFAKVLQEIAALGVSVQSAYATTTVKECALAILKTADDQVVIDSLGE